MVFLFATATLADRVGLSRTQSYGLILIWAILYMIYYVVRVPLVKPTPDTVRQVRRYQIIVLVGIGLAAASYAVWTCI